jgi:YVTN family beta-propeller protein
VLGGGFVEFRILGPIEVASNGETLAIGQGKQRAVLALLLLGAGEVVSSDTLIDELWDGRAPATAQKSLQVYVSRLRKVLGDGIIVTEARGYKLDVAPEAVDLHRFERLVSEAREQLPPVAATTLRDALSLWRGGALADVADQPFAQRPIARLEELRLTAIEDRIEADLALGRHGQLAAELEGLVQQHPYRERLRAQLMLALYRMGRQADALAAYRDARATLADELGLEPGPELRALEQRILSQDPALDVAAEARAPEVPSRRKRRVVMLMAGLGLLAIAAVVSVVLTTRGDDASPVVAAPNSVTLIDAEASRAVQSVGVGERPSDIAVNGDDLWVLHPDRSTITHLSRSSREVTGTVGIGGAPSDLAAEPRGVWVSDARTGAVTLIERERLVPARTIPTRTRPVAGGPFSGRSGQLAIGFGSLWLASGDNVIARIDLTTGRLAARIPGVDTGESNSGIAPGFGSVWVAGPLQESPVTRIDPRRNDVEVEIPLHKFRGSGIAVGGGGVWVSDVGGDQVWRIDPARNSPSGSTKVGLGPLGVAYGAGSIWVANSGDGTVSRIDPVTAKVVETIDLGGSPNSIAVVGDEVWVTVA